MIQHPVKPPYDPISASIASERKQNAFQLCGSGGTFQTHPGQSQPAQRGRAAPPVAVQGPPHPVTITESVHLASFLFCFRHEDPPATHLLLTTSPSSTSTTHFSSPPSTSLSSSLSLVPLAVSTSSLPYNRSVLVLDCGIWLAMATLYEAYDKKSEHQGLGWADQWDYKYNDKYGHEEKDKKGGNNPKLAKVKTAASSTKNVVSSGASKVASGTSNGLKWIKGKVQKKPVQQTQNQQHQQHDDGPIFDE